MVSVKCVVCSKTFQVHNYRKETAIACSRNCLGVYVGKVRREKQNVRISTQGYRFVKRTGYHRADKQDYAKCADIVLEEKIGRKLFPSEIAHHIDHNKLNDSPENLEVMDMAVHSGVESKERWDKVRKFNWSIYYKQCVSCGTTSTRHWARGHCKWCYRREFIRKKGYENHRCDTKIALGEK